MGSNKITLTKEIKVALLQALKNGFITRDELCELFPTCFQEQPLFVDNEEIKRISDVLEASC